MYVGEKAYFRVVDKGRDLSDEKDVVSVVLKTTSGRIVTNQMSETQEHSGKFTGFIKAISVAEMAVASNAFDAIACAYGDDMVAAYRTSSGEKVDGKVYIYKGSDGLVQQFTKRFKDPDLAVKTQFAMAEAYFEMAKKHRQMKEEEVARREIRQGKKLLEEALRDFPDAGARDQAEYLLANLSLESADETTDVKEKERLLAEAVQRFTDIVSTYMDGPYAPKAQYKKALCYEKLNQMDQACEEYVKLAYTYPDHELIAETITRLGQYFWNKAKIAKSRAEELKQEGDDVGAEAEYQRVRQIYNTSGEVFGRLCDRFPNHKMAGQTKTLSGQAFLQAQDYEKAVAAFEVVRDKFKNDKDLMSEASYWCGDCHLRLNKPDMAYLVWKKLTWDYPDTKWAKYARGRLTEKVMVEVAAGTEK
jgi:TolA-binding protein